MAMSAAAHSPASTVRFHRIGAAHDSGEEAEEHAAASATEISGVRAGRDAAASPSMQRCGRGCSRALFARLRRALDPRRWASLAGWPLLLSYLLVTVAQELPVTAVSMLLAGIIQPDETSEFYAATYIPWTLRPLYALLSDQLPIFGFRRRPYFLLGAIGACVLQIVLGLWAHAPRSFLAVAVCVQLSLATMEVVCDSLAVERGNQLARILIARKIAYWQQRPSSNTAQAPAASAAPHLSASVVSPQPLHVLPSAELVAPLLSPSSASAAAVGNAASPSPPPLRPVCHQLHASYSALGAHVPPSNVQMSSALPDQQRDSESSTDADSPAAEALERFLRLQAEDTFPVAADAATAGSTVLFSLSPLSLKTRLQTECMFFRTCGSLLAAATAMLLMLFLQPRHILLAAAVAAMAAAPTMLLHRERKVHTSFFGLSDVETASTRTSMPPSAVHEEHSRGVASYAAVPSIAAPVVLAAAATSSIVHSERAHLLPLSISSSSLQTSAMDSASSPSSTPPPSLTPALSAQEEFAPSAAPELKASWPLLETLFAPCFAANRWLEEGATSEGDATGSRTSFLLRKLRMLLVSLRNVGPSLLFVFLCALPPSSEDAFEQYLYQPAATGQSGQGGSGYLHLASWQLAGLNLLGLTAALFGCAAFQWATRSNAADTPATTATASASNGPLAVLSAANTSVLSRPTSAPNVRRIFVWTTVLSSVIGCGAAFIAAERTWWLLLPPQAFITFWTMLAAAASMAAAIPPTILGAHYASQRMGVEASVFSLFAAANHLGTLASAEISARLTAAMGVTNQSWSSLWKLVLLCQGAQLLPLLALPILLPSRSDLEKREAEEAKWLVAAETTKASIPESNAAQQPELRS